MKCASIERHVFRSAVGALQFPVSTTGLYQSFHWSRWNLKLNKWALQRLSVIFENYRFWLPNLKSLWKSIFVFRGQWILSPSLFRGFLDALHANNTWKKTRASLACLIGPAAVNTSTSPSLCLKSFVVNEKMTCLNIRYL